MIQTEGADVQQRNMRGQQPQQTAKLKKQVEHTEAVEAGDRWQTVEVRRALAENSGR